MFSRRSVKRWRGSAAAGDGLLPAKPPNGRRLRPRVIGRTPERVVRAGRRDRPIAQLPSIGLRVAVLGGIAVVVFAVILFRLWFLQILSGQQYVAAANENRLRTIKVLAPRGLILDRNGKVLVENRPALAVGIRPMEMSKDQLDTVVANLAAVLGMPVSAIDEILARHRKIGYKYDLAIIENDVAKDVVARILERRGDFPGVEVRLSYLRGYPMGTTAAHILGNVGEVTPEQLDEQGFAQLAPGDLIGQSGVEYTYDRWLRGRDGQVMVEVDSSNRPKKAVPGGRMYEVGDNLVLSIDARIQRAAEKALQFGIATAHQNHYWRANGGAAVVMDARSGEIVALASSPTFDPSVWEGGISKQEHKAYFTKGANNPFLDRSTMGEYAPGSTFKPVDAVAALEEGIVTPYSTFFCQGIYKNHGVTWKCWVNPSSHGSVNMYNALAESCDVYFYNLGYAFYLQKGTPLADWAGRLGLGKKTGIDVPGEAAGVVPTPDWLRKYFAPPRGNEIDRIWKPGNSINLAIGQGFLTVTPLQMAVAYAAIANGGSVVTPHLGLKVVDAAGSVVQKVAVAVPRRVDIAKSDLDVVRTGLRMAASSGIGTSTAVFGGYPVAVAGKTGTAEKPPQEPYAWYASYAPADNPKYVVVVMIEQGGHGGTTAAPAARLIYDALFNIKTGGPQGTTRTD